MSIHGYHDQALAHDGWEHAHLYHALIQRANLGHHTTIMPDIQDDHGDCMMHVMPIALNLRHLALISADSDERTKAHLQAARTAHRATLKHLGRADRS